MIDPFRHMSLRQRVSLVIWVVNIILCLTLLSFALR
jgi:hypothetical protein